MEPLLGDLNEPGSGSLAALRRTNRRRVLEALRQGPASRADLARVTGLSRTTVSSLVSDLERQGLLGEQPADGPRAGGQRPGGRRPGGPRHGGRPAGGAAGRPPILVALAARAGAAIGVDFGHRHLRVAVAD